MLEALDYQVIVEILERKQQELTAETSRVDRQIAETKLAGQPMGNDYWHKKVKLENQVMLLQKLVDNL